MDLSILICTHNSGNRIRKTLNHILNQKNVDKLDYEVLIVDYKSTDNTRKIALDLFNNSKITLKIIDEKKQGKTPALETGLYASKGNAICIVDDDNWIDENYISIAHKIINKNLDVGVIGAFGKAHCETTKPVWFENHLGLYAVGSQGSKSGYVEDEKRKWFWGAGSVFRKEAWLKAKNNGFEPIFNPSRSNDSTSFIDGFTGGEDPEMCFAIQICGYKLWYEPSLIYTHYIPKSRLNEKFIYDTVAGTAFAEPILRLYLAEITEREPLSTIRKVLYQNYNMHYLYIVIRTLISKIKYIFSKNKIYYKKELKRYNSQINSLKRFKMNFKSTILNIKKING